VRHTAKRSRKGSLTAPSLRSARGSVTPFVAMSVIFFMSVLGIAIDMMIDFQAVNQLGSLLRSFINDSA
jgi:hypothetical protein